MNISQRLEKLGERFFVTSFKGVAKCSELLGFNIDSLVARLLQHLLHKGQLNNRFLLNHGGSHDLKLFTQYIPDRYSDNLVTYKEKVNFLSFSDLDKWTKDNHQNNGGDLSRYFFLNLCLDYLIEENLAGNVAELGVFKGNSAFLLSKFAQRTNTLCYLFDTFEGFDGRDLVGGDAHFDKSSFSNTSLETVKKLIGENKNTIYVKGYFPDSLSQIDSVGEMILVHLDCDLEKPMLDALIYFYPKLKRGGFLIMHDHSSYYWPGARSAIDYFFKGKLELVVPIPDKSGTCVVRKIQ